MVAVESVLSDVYMSDAPESIPVSDADVDARNWSEYFAGVDDETLPMGGHETVIDSSSASTRMIPSLFIVASSVVGRLLFEARVVICCNRAVHHPPDGFWPIGASPLSGLVFDRKRTLTTMNFPK
jgi:hypothetical protein